jgi:hypothetical protein
MVMIVFPPFGTGNVCSIGVTMSPPAQTGRTVYVDRFAVRNTSSEGQRTGILNIILYL